jgi:hypothetical protein
MGTLLLQIFASGELDRVAEYDTSAWFEGVARVGRTLAFLSTDRRSVRLAEAVRSAKTVSTRGAPRPEGANVGYPRPSSRRSNGTTWTAPSCAMPRPCWPSSAPGLRTTIPGHRTRRSVCGARPPTGRRLLQAPPREQNFGEHSTASKRQPGPPDTASCACPHSFRGRRHFAFARNNSSAAT